MFDVGRLRVVRRTTGDTASFSFVGVRVDPVDGQRELWLPQGFESFPVADYKETVRVFFALYRVLRRYADSAQLLDEKVNQTREPFSETERGGYSHRVAIAEQLTFSRVARLERVMFSFDEALMRSLVARSLPRVPSSLERLHLSLHNALYNEDHSFFLAEMRQPVRTLELDQTELMELACFIHSELLSWTYGLGAVEPYVRQAAAAFKEKHLPTTAGLFVEGSFDDVLVVLRRELQDVLRRSAYRDDDFWVVFEAVEAFLYGDIDYLSDGIEWGVSDFYPVWEAMCHACVRRLLEDRDERVLFADTAPQTNTFTDGGPFVLRTGTHSRRLAPDLVAIEGFDFAKWFRARFEIRLVPDEPEAEVFSVRVQQVESVDPKLVSLADLRRVMQKCIKGGRPTEISRSAFQYKSVARTAWTRALSKFESEQVAQFRRRVKRSFVIDFKYAPMAAFADGPLGAKAEDDIRKSLVYELALTGRPEVAGTTVRSQFIVPMYLAADDEREFIFLGDANDLTRAKTKWTPNALIAVNRIDVIALSFMTAVVDYAALVT